MSRKLLWAILAITAASTFGCAGSPVTGEVRVGEAEKVCSVKDAASHRATIREAQEQYFHGDRSSVL